MMPTNRYSQNLSQSSTEHKFPGAETPNGRSAWAPCPFSLGSQLGHPGASPGSRVLYLAGPTRLATFGPKILRKMRQSRGRAASQALLSPSRIAGLALLAGAVLLSPQNPSAPAPVAPAFLLRAGLRRSGSGQAGRRKCLVCVFLSKGHWGWRPRLPLHRVTSSPPNEIQPRRQFFTTSALSGRSWRTREMRVLLKATQQP